VGYAEVMLEPLPLQPLTLQSLSMVVTSIPGFAEPVSSLTHLLGAGVFVGLAPLLIRRGAGERPRVIALAIFSLVIVVQLGLSGIYHLLPLNSVARGVFQQLDHAAIFALIAGSFTPIHMILYRGFGRWGMLLLVWGIAVTAITVKTIYFAELPRGVGLGLYLGMGWIGLGSGISLYRRYNWQFVAPVFWGGIAYSVGAVLEALHWPTLIPGVFQWHEVFHVAVLIGLALHWSFIYAIADGRLAPNAPPPSDSLPQIATQPHR
jgi:channel protein (hemolysin III family)